MRGFMLVEISLGELVDKITILKIKSERITDAAKLKNVEKEYLSLLSTLKQTDYRQNDATFFALYEINRKLWEVEDKLRLKEAKKEFDADFVALARAVYFTNDERAAIKKNINISYNSSLIEEKQYCEYK